MRIEWEYFETKHKSDNWLEKNIGKLQRIQNEKL